MNYLFITKKWFVLGMMSMSLISACSSDNETVDPKEDNIGKKLEGQWFVAGIKQVSHSGAINMYALLENSYKDTDGSVTTERPPALRFTNDEQVTVSDNPKGNNNFGMYFPWSDGLYKYVASDTGQEKKILVVDGIQGKFWFVESEDAIYFQIDNYNLFESETFILKRDTERNRYPSFYSRDEQINLMAFDSLPEWLRTEAEKKRNSLIAYGKKNGMVCELYIPDPPYTNNERVYRFLLNGQTLYGWAPGFPGDYVFFTEDGKGVDIEESGMFYRNNYDIYYNSIEWELVYVFESIR